MKKIYYKRKEKIISGIVGLTLLAGLGFIIADTYEPYVNMSNPAKYKFIDVDRDGKPDVGYKKGNITGWQAFTFKEGYEEFCNNLLAEKETEEDFQMYFGDRPNIENLTK